MSFGPQKSQRLRFMEGLGEGSYSRVACGSALFSYVGFEVTGRA